jgi:hypothetical protein
MTGLMCVVKNYVDVSILPFVGSHGKKQKKEKKAEKATGEPKRKASSWELLTSSPRILNMTLMVRMALDLLEYCSTIGSGDDGQLARTQWQRWLALRSDVYHAC